MTYATYANKSNSQTYRHTVMDKQPLAIGEILQICLKKTKIPTFGSIFSDLLKLALTSFNTCHSSDNHYHLEMHKSTFSKKGDYLQNNVSVRMMMRIVDKLSLIHYPVDLLSNSQSKSII